MSITGGAVPKNAKRSASLVRKATTAAANAVSKKQNASLSKSASATMMHQMKSSLSSSMSSEKILVESSPASRQGSADSGIGKEEPIKEADDEKFSLPPRITTYSEYVTETNWLSK